MDAKISGGMFEEKTAYLYNLKYLPQVVIFLTTKKNNNHFIG